MKKPILLLLFIIPLICYGQLNDTIFFKNGKIEPVYSIDLISKNKVYYTPKQYAEQINVDLELIHEFNKTSSEKLLVEKNIVNPSENLPINWDTIYFKSGETYPVYKISRVTEKRIFFYIDEYNKTNIDKSLVEGYTSNLQTETNQPDLDYFRANHNLPELDYKIGWVKHNLDKFYRQKRASHIVMGAGILSGIVYGLNPLENTAFGYITGILGLAAFIIDIDSYKWIKRASLETSVSSVTLKVNF